MNGKASNRRAKHRHKQEVKKIIKFKSIEIPVITACLGILFIIIELAAASNYPLFRDELYYIECANHPAFGYVDQPPLSILILTVWKAIFGDSLLSIRIIPALSGAVLIGLTSMLTKELGGRKFEQIFSSVTVFSGLYYLATGGFYSMNVFDSLFWINLFLILIKILKTTTPYQQGYVNKGLTPNQGEIQSESEASAPPLLKERALGGGNNLWLWFGIIAGLGLMNKISVGYLGLGIFVAILLTNNCAWLKQKKIWLGGIIAIAIFSPYIIWNVFNNYATVEFIQNAQRYKIAALSPIDFLKEQILLINPLSAPVWITGLIALLFGSLKKYRVIGITYVVILGMLILMRSKPYYLAAVYPVLIAAGSVSLASLIPKLLIRYLYPVLLLISMAIFAPFVIPVLMPEDAVNHIKWLGIMPSSGERMRQSELPQILADRFGWEEMTEKVAKVYSSLSENEKKYTAIFGQNYGEAGAINYYGRKYNLPRAISGHNSYWLWGPYPDTIATVIIIGGDKEDNLEFFYEVTEMERTSSPFAMPFENNLPIYLARGLKRPLKEIWPELRFYI